MEYIVSPKTDINLREDNGDAFGHYNTPYGDIYIVCDGFGAEDGGCFAGNWACNQFPRFLSDAAGKGLPIHEALAFATKGVNDFLYQNNQKSNLKTGTTMVLALDSSQGIIIAHVGDSRAYLVEKSGALLSLTRDHSPVGDLMRDGKISPLEAMSHPKAHILSRAFGSQADLTLEVHPGPINLQPGQGLLLCTDGLTGFATEDEIRGTLSTLDPIKAADLLIDLAKRRNSDDNITVLYLTAKRPKAHQPVAPMAGNAPMGGLANVNYPMQGAQPPAEPSYSGPSTHYTAPRAKRSGTSLTDYWEIPAIFFFGLFLTFIHYYSMFVPYNGDTMSGTQSVFVVPVGLDLEEEKKTTGASEYETIKAYNWTAADCPLPNEEDRLRDFTHRQARPSLAEEERVGAEIVRQLSVYFGDRLDNDKDMVDYIQSLGSQVASWGNRGVGYTFHVVDMNYANIFVVPSGHVYITTGLLNDVIENEAQLAFAIAHEIAHLDKYHTSELLLALRMIPGVGETDMAIVLSRLMAHPYTLRQEHEADRYASMWLVKDQYSPFQATRVIKLWGREDMAPYSGSDGAEMDHLRSSLEELQGSVQSEYDRICRWENMTLKNLSRSQHSEFYIGNVNYHNKETRFMREY